MLPLSGCSSAGGTKLRFYQSKPEVVAYFDKLVETYNSQHSNVRVTHDSTSSLVASFVRESPHDLVLNNYDLSAGTFVSRGVLSNLADLPEAQRINPNVQALVGQYASYNNETSVLPYSVAAEGVIYNRDLFQQHGQRVPTTWSELIAVADAFKSKGITAIQSTYQAPWTIQQGLFDYVSGGMIDVAGFFAQMKDAGDKAGSASGPSFQATFKPAVDKMLQLATYANADAPSRTYPDGNVAFSQNKAAMYLQGPWALGEVAKANPNVKMGTFALPATDSPADTKARVNLDLAMWIPRAAAEPGAARDLLHYLMSPEVMNKYNADNLGFSPVKDAPAVTDERTSELQPYISAGKFYQGAATYIPTSIPLGNYLQELVLGRDGAGFLRKLDNDWNRLAQRTV